MEQVYEHIGQGRIVYDPSRPGMKRRTEWWCIAQIDREITRYYRYWANQNPVVFGETHLDLCLPSWDAHISIVRGEVPREEFRHHWKKYHGKTITFRYSHCLRRTRNHIHEKDYFWFIDVQSPEIDEIREELGLRTFYNYHITVGRIY